MKSSNAVRRSRSGPPPARVLSGKRIKLSTPEKKVIVDTVKKQFENGGPDSPESKNTLSTPTKNTQIRPPYSFLTTAQLKDPELDSLAAILQSIENILSLYHEKSEEKITHLLTVELAELSYYITQLSWSRGGLKNRHTNICWNSLALLHETLKKPDFKKIAFPILRFCISQQGDFSELRGRLMHIMRVETINKISDRNQFNFVGMQLYKGVNLKRQPEYKLFGLDNIRKLLQIYNDYRHFQCISFLHIRLKNLKFLYNQCELEKKKNALALLYTIQELGELIKQISDSFIKHYLPHKVLQHHAKELAYLRDIFRHIADNPLKIDQANLLTENTQYMLDLRDLALQFTQQTVSLGKTFLMYYEHIITHQKISLLNPALSDKVFELKPIDLQIGTAFLNTVKLFFAYYPEKLRQDITAAFSALISGELPIPVGNDSKKFANNVARLLSDAQKRPHYSRTKTLLKQLDSIEKSPGNLQLTYNDEKELVKITCPDGCEIVKSPKGSWRGLFTAKALLDREKRYKETVLPFLKQLENYAKKAPQQSLAIDISHYRLRWRMLQTLEKDTQMMVDKNTITLSNGVIFCLDENYHTHMVKFPDGSSMQHVPLYRIEYLWAVHTLQPATLNTVALENLKKLFIKHLPINMKVDKSVSWLLMAKKRIDYLLDHIREAILLTKDTPLDLIQYHYHELEQNQIKAPIALTALKLLLTLVGAHIRHLRDNIPFTTLYQEASAFLNDLMLLGYIGNNIAHLHDEHGSQRAIEAALYATRHLQKPLLEATQFLNQQLTITNTPTQENTSPTVLQVWGQPGAVTLWSGALSPEKKQEQSNEEETTEETLDDPIVVVPQKLQF